VFSRIVPVLEYRMCFILKSLSQVGSIRSQGFTKRYFKRSVYPSAHTRVQILNPCSRVPYFMPGTSTVLEYVPAFDLW